MVNGLAPPSLAAAAFFRDISCPVYEKSAVARPYAPAAMFAGSDHYGRRHTCINYELGYGISKAGSGQKDPKSRERSILGTSGGGFEPAASPRWPPIPCEPR